MADFNMVMNSLSSMYTKNSSAGFKSMLSPFKNHKPVGTVIITNGDQNVPEPDKPKDTIALDLTSGRGIGSNSGLGINTSIDMDQLDALIAKLEELKTLADSNVSEANATTLLQNQQDFLLVQSDVVEVSGTAGTTSTTQTTTNTTVLDAIDLTGADPIFLDISGSNFNFTNGISIEAQVKLNDTSDRTLVSADNFTLAVHNGNLEFSVKLQDGSTVTSVAGAVTAGSYMHVAGTYSGTSVKSYLDGVMGTRVAASGNLAAVGNDLYLGNEAGSTNAYMADIRVFNDARTSDEINENMHRLVDVSDTNLLANYVMDSATSSIIDRKGNAVTLAGGTVVGAYSGGTESSTGISIGGNNEIIVEKLAGGQTVLTSTTSNSFRLNLIALNGTSTTITPELDGKGQLVDPTVAALSDGSFVVSYTQWKGAGKDIYYERYNSSGVKITNATVVNTTTADFQTEGNVTALTDGGFVFTWESKDQGTTDIYAQRFNAAGVKVGGETRINTTTAGNQNKPIVEALSNGGYMIAYEDASGSDGSGTGIRARIFDSANVGGAEFQVNSTTAGNQDNIRIEQLTNGNIVVAYNDAANSGDVKARIFNTSGTQVVAEFTVNPNPTNGAQNAQSLVGLANGKFAVSYTDDASGSSVIKAQIFNADGTRDGNAFQLSDGVSNSSDIAVDSSGNLIVYYNEGGTIKKRTFTEGGGGMVGGSGTPNILDNGFSTSEDITTTTTTQLTLGDAELQDLADQLSLDRLSGLVITNNSNAQLSSDILAQYISRANSVKEAALETTPISEDVAMLNLASEKNIATIGQARDAVVEVSATKENLSDLVLRSVFDMFREQSSTFIDNLVGPTDTTSTKLEPTEIEKVMFGEKTIAEKSPLENKDGNFGSGDNLTKLNKETSMTAFDEVLKGKVNGYDTKNNNNMA